MPIEFLRELADAELPLGVSDEGQIDKLRVLAAAGMVTASLPPAGTGGPAQVLTVTGLGRATLKLGRIRLKEPMIEHSV